jgi:hypothetical protein
LNLELPNDEHSKDKVGRFLREVEDFTILHLQKYGFSESMVNEKNIEYFKKGLMYQVRYFLDKGRNGKLSPLAWDYFHQKGFIHAIRG